MNDEILRKLLEMGGNNMTHEEYHKLWNDLGPLEIKMTKQYGECKHNIGDVFNYNNPYDKPKDACNALLHVLDLYVWRVALNFPSWEADDSTVHRIHCPSKNGSVWELRKI
jgi:uncharacterized repeat protein (TIGR04076 family)